MTLIRAPVEFLIRSLQGTGLQFESGCLAHFKLQVDPDSSGDVEDDVAALRGPRAPGIRGDGLGFGIEEHELEMSGGVGAGSEDGTLVSVG